MTHSLKHIGKIADGGSLRASFDLGSEQITCGFLSGLVGPVGSPVPPLRLLGFGEAFCAPRLQFDKDGSFHR